MSAHAFHPNARVSGKPCFVICCLHVGAMVYVFAALYTGTPTGDINYHPKGMPFPSSQKIITSISCGVDGI